jgi:hypothetical protein
MANNPTSQEQIVVHGALPHIVELAEDNNDTESQRQALLTLSNLAANEINHHTMMSRDTLAVLLSAFNDSPDMDCREYAAFAIANLCSNPDYLHSIGFSGGIPPLIMLSKSLNVNTQCLSLAALRRLADCDENWPRLIQHGVLDSLSSGGYSTEVEIQREVAAAICSLSLSEPHRLEIAYKCVQTIIHLSMTGDGEVARQAVGSIANLAEDVDTHEYIAKGGGGKCLIALEAHKSLDIQREATRGIANLLSSFRHQAAFIEDGIPGLVHLAFSTDEECSYHAAMCFRKLSPNLKSHPIMVYAGAFKALFHLLKSSNVNTQKQAAAALRDICANPDYKLKCAEEGGIRALIGINTYNTYIIYYSMCAPPPLAIYYE